MIRRTPFPLTAFLVLSAMPSPAAGPSPSAVAGNEQVRKIMETYEGRGTLADGSAPTSAREALRQFHPRLGFAVDLMAAEPDVEQPLYMNWDSRGRLWVVQYRQYQFPAGLKVVSYDSHLRARFDQTPLPPPKGIPGDDKVTFFEDADGDGFFERHTDVLSALNIVSAALPGAGAVWVLNPPYLLRYPDADADGKPDGDPEVVLSGFGLEDTHSVANSLQWGVDGWLYGANGSTTTGNVSSTASKNVRWEGQCIWRYHPVSRKFEVYAEGGGNTFSLDIDSKGRVFSGTNGGGTRGMHYEQGSYGVKSWGKHGPLTNSHAYGWFNHMRHEGDAKRFPQAFVVYEGGLFDAKLDGRIIAPNSLANLVYLSDRIPDGSTFRTVDQVDLLSSADRWFRPVDAKVGPDGALYLADWYDTRLSHVRPVDDWHKTSGRIYRVRPEGSVPKVAPFDLHTAPAADLLARLSDGNRWFRRQAALEMGWRHLRELVPALLKKLRAPGDPYALDALFALDMLDAVDATLSGECFKHPDPYIRRWAVKIVGEKGAAWADCAAPLAALAKTEEHLEVRAQILATAKRLPAAAGLPLVLAVELPLPPEETRIPLLGWWALESKCGADPEAVLSFIQNQSAFVASPVFRDHLVQRLGQRLASGGVDAELQTCAKLWSLLPPGTLREKLMTGVSAAFEGAEIPQLPEPLAKALRSHLENSSGGALASALRTGDAGAVQEALKLVADSKAKTAERLAVANGLAALGRGEAVPVFAAVLSNASTAPGLRRGVLQAAARYSDMAIPNAVLGGYEAKFAGDKMVRETALAVLAGRLEWAHALLEAVDSWKVPVKHFTPEVLNLLRQHKDPGIEAALQRHWKGALGVLSMEAKAEEAKRLRQALAGGEGDSDKGRGHFQARCASCHKLFAEGGVVGPELTGYERGNREFWVDNIVYPSLEIREGYGNYTVRLTSGQILTGMLDAQNSSGVVLRDLSGQKTAIRQTDIASLEANPVSVMPEGLLGGLSPAELRDLFAYLMRKETR